MLANNLTRLGVKAEDLSQVRSKMESLKEQDQELDKRIRDLERDIQILETQQIDKKQLRGVFRDFVGLYADAPPETKRRLLNVIIEEIRCSVKRGKRLGKLSSSSGETVQSERHGMRQNKTRSQGTPILEV
jgi:hypothetical protein